MHFSYDFPSFASEQDLRARVTTGGTSAEDVLAEQVAEGEQFARRGNALIAFDGLLLVVAAILLQAEEIHEFWYGVATVLTALSAFLSLVAAGSRVGRSKIGSSATVDDVISAQSMLRRRSVVIEVGTWVLAPALIILELAALKAI